MTKSVSSAKQGKQYAAVQRVLLWVLFANLLVTTVKITLGFLTGALAVIADGFHSLVDSSSNLIGLLSIRMAKRPADEIHPYGYSRYESLGALAIGGLLIVAAWEIGTSVIGRIFSGTQLAFESKYVLLIALTLPVNILIVYIETRAAKKLKSEILLADAKHTKTDLYITVSVLLSLAGVSLGWEWLDAAVALAVVLLILKAAFGILADTTRWLTDTNVADASIVEQIANSSPGVRGVHRIRSRGTPDAAFVDLHVKVSPEMDTSQAHAVASEVERRIIKNIENVTDALVHIEPAAEQNYNPWERISYDVRTIADGMGLGAHDLHIHTDMNGAYTLEVHLEILDSISLGQAHEIADKFERRVMKRWTQIEKIISHMEPMHRKILLPEETPKSELEPKIREILTAYVKTTQILKVAVYQFSNHLSSVITISLPFATPLADAHEVSESIEADLLKNVPGLQRVTVHLEPEE